MPSGYDEVGIAFDMDVLLTQSAVVERDTAVAGPYGEEAVSKYEVVATLPCFFAWWHTESGRSTMREWADPETTVFYRGATMYLPPGSDIRDGDHVANIIFNEVVLEAGPFQVNAVQPWEDHVEVQLVGPAAE